MWKKTLKDAMSHATLKGLQTDFLNDFESRLKEFSDGLTRLHDVGFEESSVTEMYRINHNIKGTAATLELEEISEIAQSMEKILLNLIHGRLAFSPMVGEDLKHLLRALKELALSYLKGARPAQLKKEKNRLMEHLFLNTIQILIVHSDRSVRQKIKEQLEKAAGEMELEIRESPDSLEALPLAIQYPLDLICIEEHFPILEGHDFIRMLRVLEEKKHLVAGILSREIVAVQEGEYFSVDPEQEDKALIWGKVLKEIQLRKQHV